MKHNGWIFPMLRRLSNSMILNLSLPFWSRIVYQPTCYFYWRPLCSLSLLLKRTCSVQHVSWLEQHTLFSATLDSILCRKQEVEFALCAAAAVCLLVLPDISQTCRSLNSLSQKLQADSSTNALHNWINAYYNYELSNLSLIPGRLVWGKANLLLVLEVIYS